MPNVILIFYLLETKEKQIEFTGFEGWGKKYVSNVLKANGYTKTFLRNCQKPVTNSNALDERAPAQA